MENLKKKFKKIKKIREGKVINYADYLCENLDNSITYSEYISESNMNYSNKNISYSEYLSEKKH